MATNIDWPIAVPVPKLDPYSVKPDSPVLESDMGYALLRRQVYSDAPERIDIALLLSRTQEQIFRAFVRFSLSFGTQYFNMPILANGTYNTREVQIIGGQPDYRPANTPNFTLVTFSVKSRGSLTPVPDVELAYDPIVLARNPFGYWRLDEASPTTSFFDLSGNGHNLSYTGLGLTYEQMALNTDPGGSVGRDESGSNFRLQYALGHPEDVPGIGADDPCTCAAWAYINNDDLATTKSLCFVGGAGGGGQFTKMWFFRGADGLLYVAFHRVVGGFISLEVSGVTLPIAEAFWFVAGVDPGNNEFFFKLNDDAPVFVSTGGAEILQRPDATTSVCFMCRQSGNNGNPLNGFMNRAEFYLEALPNLDMWTDWHL